MATQTIRPIRLTPEAYAYRRTPSGWYVRDLMPWEGAVDYVTDGTLYGVFYEDGIVHWMGASVELAFGEGIRLAGE